MKNIRAFYLKLFGFSEVRFFAYLHRRVFVMQKLLSKGCRKHSRHERINFPNLEDLLVVQLSERLHMDGLE